MQPPERWQKTQPPFDIGDTVWARGVAWILRDTVEHDDCVSLRLSPAAGGWETDDVVLLHPADHIVRERGNGRAVAVSRPAFWSSLACHIASLRPHDALTTPARAAIDILPYQLEPAIAVLRGARRLLLADAVGLGKTVESAIVISERLARDDDARCLVLVPAGLRDQWRDELAGRFRLEANAVDGDVLRELAHASASTVPPWSIPRLAIVSIDLAKRPEVLAALCNERWDLVVVDEAHAVSLDTLRLRAVHALAVRAGCTLLVTATPHSGDDARFEALTTIGASGPADRLIVFRRTRADVGLPVRRRSVLLRVRPSRHEVDALALLLDYAREAWTGGMPASRLVATFLLKRALSNPAALASSLARRRALLESSPAVAEQLTLPWPNADDDDADDEPQEVLAAPAMASRARELAWLDRAGAMAARAAAASTKLAALVRFVRRTREPVLVFTEFRDTLDVVAEALGRRVRVTTLHGGLTRAERREAVAAFTGGRADVMVATDTGGAGLNLHARCRVVVHLELPWNPVRLEQRLGRVDRIGQHQRVHAVHLVARGTPEARILGRLAERSLRATAALGRTTREAAGCLCVSDEQIAEAILGLSAPATLWAARPSSEGRRRLVPPPQLELASNVDEGRRQAAAQEALRRLIRGPVGARRHRPRQRPARAGIVRVRFASSDRQRGGAAALSPGAGHAFAVFTIALVDAHHRVIDEHPIVLRMTTGAGRPDRMKPRAVCRIMAGAVRDSLDAEVARRIAEVRESLTRQRAPESTVARPPVQPGLFDRRAQRARSVQVGSDSGQPEPSNGELALAHPPRLGWVWWPHRG